MINHDTLQTQKQALWQRIGTAVKEGDDKAFAQAFTEFADGLQQEILQEARTLHDQTDAAILAARGVRQLTGEEHDYYQKVIEAMRGANPKQVLSELDVVMPKTTIDAVFDDLTDQHPLLDALDFQNTSNITEWLMNTNTKQLAAWGPLTDKIIKELSSGFKKVDVTQKKLSAFIPVAKAMLDLGPAWLDRYVRTVLQEALYLGLEEAILNGTGKDMPIGMNRQVGEGVTVTGGVYPEKAMVKVDSLDPVTYGTLLAGMAKTPNGHARTVSGVILVVSPNDYLTKIMPATTVRTVSGEYANNVLPFPTTIIQSVQMPNGKAILGLPQRYFMGIGTAKSGKLDFSDEYKFLEDERVYLVKLYGHGEPKDNNAFVYCNISGLKPVVQQVEVKGVVTTEAKA